MKKLTNDLFIARAKILSDSTRLSILEILARNESLCACKILDELHISQGTLSHHMKILTASKIVTCRKDGKWRYYRVAPEILCEMASFIQSICLSSSRSDVLPCNCQSGDKKK